MKPIAPYLFFDGNCREAMNFYKQCFGGTLDLITYADAPPQKAPAHSEKDKIMHSSLRKGDFSIMASDNPKSTPVVGDNIHLSIDCQTIPEVQALFKAMSQGGTITMPLADTFWGSHFGMLIDKFGIYWMFNVELKK